MSAQSARRCGWSPHLAFDAAITPNLRRWVTGDDGSLTARLVAASERFRVARLLQRPQRPLADEWQVLGQHDRTPALTREVLLICDDIPAEVRPYRGALPPCAPRAGRSCAGWASARWAVGCLSIRRWRASRSSLRGCCRTIRCASLAARAAGHGATAHAAGAALGVPARRRRHARDRSVLAGPAVAAISGHRGDPASKVFARMLLLACGARRARGAERGAVSFRVSGRIHRERPATCAPQPIPFARAFAPGCTISPTGPAPALPLGGQTRFRAFLKVPIDAVAVRRRRRNPRRHRAEPAGRGLPGGAACRQAHQGQVARRATAVRAAVGNRAGAPDRRHDGRDRPGLPVGMRARG